MVREAARAGLKVAAHCMTEAGARNAVEAGVASIEHGFTMTDETLALAKRRRVVLVGTDFTRELLDSFGLGGAARRRSWTGCGGRGRRGRPWPSAPTSLAGGRPVAGSWAMSQVRSYVEVGHLARARHPADDDHERRAPARRGGGPRRHPPGHGRRHRGHPRQARQDILALEDVVFVMKDGRVVKRP